MMSLHQLHGFWPHIQPLLENIKNQETCVSTAGCGNFRARTDVSHLSVKHQTMAIVQLSYLSVVTQAVLSFLSRTQQSASEGRTCKSSFCQYGRSTAEKAAFNSKPNLHLANSLATVTVILTSTGSLPSAYQISCHFSIPSVVPKDQSRSEAPIYCSYLCQV